MKVRSLNRRTGAGLLAALALVFLAQALVNARLPNNPRPPNVAPFRPWSYASTTDVRASGSVAGTAFSQSLETVPAGRATVRVPILMYHYIRVNPDPRDALGGALSVTPDDFSAQMDWLARSGYHPIDLDDLRGYLLANATLPAKPVVISLDDGYSDLYTAAYPVLKRHQFKAVAYVVTGFLGRPSNVTSQQVVEMNANGIEIGSHTVTHPDLTKLPPNELKRQLDDSKVTLEALLGHPVLDFCYPSGAENPAVVQAVQAAGYQSATTTHSGTGHSAADRYEWTRVRVSGGEPLPEFETRLGSSEPSQPAAAPSSVPTFSTSKPLLPPLIESRGQRALPVVPSWESLTP
jgi:peptidoglycan/xylan/chitin deacetylase (PgdA/CDA1 family)